MRYVVVYFFVIFGGNKNLFVLDINDIFFSVGIDVDFECFDVVIKEFSGKNINEVGIFLVIWLYNLNLSVMCFF